MSWGSGNERSEEAMNVRRRDLMLQGLFGAGMWGLRSLATGIPVSLLMNPRRALASDAAVAGPANTAAQYVIFSTSENGDPINANVPGTYGVTVPSGFAPPIHPTFPVDAAGGGGTNTPWSSAAIGATAFSRVVFFHHATYTVVHPDEPTVLHLMNTAPSAEMFPSMLSAQLAPQLGTIQAQPVALGPENITFQNRPQPSLSPVALAEILGSPTGPLGHLQPLRDKYLDKLNAIVRSQGNSAQQAFIDQYALSQRQAREVSENLLSKLQSIPDNSQTSQAIAAAILIQMNVAPVITIHLGFGGDNHTDTNLAGEVAQTGASFATITTLMNALQGATVPGTSTTYADRVTFVSLNVFGRTLAINNNGTAANGRTHNQNHHCAVIIGKPFQACTVGGIEPSTATNDWSAQAIDSNGLGVGPGDSGAVIPFTDTFNSMAKTVCAGVGVSPTFYNDSTNIVSGQVVKLALAT
jgi:hypothetical protein